MLSRVADNLYWMSRYLERAEHTARLLDVNLTLMLDQSSANNARRWQRLFASLRVAPPIGTIDAYTVTEYLTFDLAASNSIIAYIDSARENARQIREQISSEMWNQLNSLHLQLREVRMADLWEAEPHGFFQRVKEGSHLFQGITDATLTHGEGWHFIQVGRALERTIATAALLDAHFADFPATTGPAEPGTYLEWVGLLKSCTAFEAYSKVYRNQIKPDSVAEFLLLNAQFPRSVRFAADTIQHSLQAITQATGSPGGSRTDRLAGRLHASLNYAQIDEIMPGTLPAFLETLQRQSGAIHNAIHQTYIAYPIDAALMR